MRLKNCAVFSIFFFQAEDGIRDHCVTGVQTCALPISNVQFNETLPLSVWNKSNMAGIFWSKQTNHSIMAEITSLLLM